MQPECPKIALPVVLDSDEIKSLVAREFPTDFRPKHATRIPHERVQHGKRRGRDEESSYYRRWYVLASQRIHCLVGNIYPTASTGLALAQGLKKVTVALA